MFFWQNFRDLGNGRPQKKEKKTLTDGRNPVNSSFARVGRKEKSAAGSNSKSAAGSNSSVPPTQWVFVLSCIVQQHVSIALFTTSTHHARATKRSKAYRSGKWGIQSFCDICRASQPRRSNQDSTLVWAVSQHLFTPARKQGHLTVALVWAASKHVHTSKNFTCPYPLVWRCQNTLTSARTPRLHGFTCPYASVWAVSKHADTRKNTKASFTCPYPPHS